MKNELNLIMSNNLRIDEEKYKSILQYIKLIITEKYEFPQEIVHVGGVTIATLGNFSASTGKPKSKKTFNVSAIVASALSGKEVLKYKAELPPCKNRILYIDTEQSKCHCHKVLERILTLAGLPTDQENDRIQFFVLREYTPEQRRDIISWALHEEQNIGLVIIDGIRDLIHDINSPSESLNIINELMRWSSYYELHIHTVLHLNKGDDNTRGHVGTELNNKAETVLQVSKNMENGKISEVRAMHIRDKEFVPFAFMIGEDSYIMDTPGFSSLYVNDFEKEELKYYFPEFELYEGQCRFNGCDHIHEPGCAVKEAVEKGKIHAVRYEDYKELYEELKNKRRY